jgi:hypothetical protein
LGSDHELPARPSFKTAAFANNMAYPSAEAKASRKASRAATTWPLKGSKSRTLPKRCRLPPAQTCRLGGAGDERYWNLLDKRRHATGARLHAVASVQRLVRTEVGTCTDGTYMRQSVSLFPSSPIHISTITAAPCTSTRLRAYARGRGQAANTDYLCPRPAA